MPEANSTLASTFAAIFLGLEVLLKLLPLSLVSLDQNIVLYGGDKKVAAKDLIVVIVYSGLCVVSVLGLFGIKDLRERDVATAAASAEEGEQERDASINGGGSADEGKSASLLAAAPARKGAIDFSKVTAAIDLWWTDPSVLLLAPVQITFGFCAAMLAANGESTARPGDPARPAR